MKFLDRVEERTRLLKLLNGTDGALACLYGRRRCGKTRLLHECVEELPNTIYYLADRSERPAQLARFVKESTRVFPAMAAAAPDDWGSVLDLWTALAPRDAVLVLDEFPYLVEKDEALPSVLQRIVDTIVSTGHKIVICGSSQRMMQGLVLKASEPLYGRAREILPIRPLGFGWLREAFPKMTPFQRLQLWCVCGGGCRVIGNFRKMSRRSGGRYAVMLQIRLAFCGMSRITCCSTMLAMRHRLLPCSHSSAGGRIGRRRLPRGCNVRLPT